MNSMTLLNAWEQGLCQSAPARALLLLASAWPERSAAEWARASIGERDRNLLRLREELFGPRLEATGVCPRCGERVEMGFTTQEIAPPAPASPASLTAHFRAESSGYVVQYRLPTSSDVLEASDARELLQRCIES